MSMIANDREGTPGMQQLTDEELIRHGRASGSEDGSNPYLIELFLRHQPRVALWALRFTGDKEQAAVLTQDILTDAWREFGSYPEDGEFTTWLYTLARNHCLNSVHSNPGKTHGSTASFEGELAATHELFAHEKMSRLEQTEATRKLIRDSLDENERTVFALEIGEELPAETIARLLEFDSTEDVLALLSGSRRKLLEAAQRWRPKDETTRSS
jgi:RNA polymerase sigma-70 factor (ECF subfamily)